MEQQEAVQLLPTPTEGAAELTQLNQPASPASPTELPPALVNKLLWRILPPVWLGYVLNIIDRQNLGYAQLQMARELHLSHSAFGMASGIFFLAYSIMQVPSNHLIARVGARRILACSMCGWGVFSASTSLARGTTSLYTLRFCLGLAEAGYFPGVLLYLTGWFPDQLSGRALALYGTAPSVGSLLGNLSSGWLLGALDGVQGVGGWRWLLLVQGLPAVGLGLLLPCLIAEEPKDAAWLAPEHAALLSRALSRPSCGAPCVLTNRSRVARAPFDPVSPAAPPTLRFQSSRVLGVRARSSVPAVHRA